MQSGLTVAGRASGADHARQPYSSNQADHRRASEASSARINTEAVLDENIGGI
jgi:hypothetical protein